MLPIYHIYQWSDGAPDLEPHLLAYTKAFPDSYIAHLLLAQFCMDYAWSARGYSWNHNTNARQERLYAEYLNKAYHELVRSIQLNDNNPEAFSLMLNLGKQSGKRNDAFAEKIFKSAIGCDPTYLPAYQYYVAYLSPYWGGNFDTFIHFVNECAHNPPPNSLVSLVYISTHEALRADDDHEMQKPVVWAETKRIYTDLIKRFPDSQYVDYLAYYSSFNDTRLANQMFWRMGANWHPEVWKNANDVLDHWGKSYTPEQTRQQIAAKLLEQLKKQPPKTDWQRAVQALLQVVAGQPYEPYAKTVMPMLNGFEWEQAKMLMDYLNGLDQSGAASSYSNTHPYQLEAARYAAQEVGHSPEFNGLLHAEPLARRACALDSDPSDVSVLCNILNVAYKCTETLLLVEQHLRFDPAELLKASPEQLAKMREWGGLGVQIELLEHRADAARQLNLRKLTVDTLRVLTRIETNDPYHFLRLANIYTRKDSGFYDPQKALPLATKAATVAKQIGLTNVPPLAEFIQAKAHAELGLQATMPNDAETSDDLNSFFYYFETPENVHEHYPNFKPAPDSSHPAK
jgi:hypothetical protein